MAASRHLESGVDPGNEVGGRLEIIFSKFRECFSPEENLTFLCRYIIPCLAKLLTDLGHSPSFTSLVPEKGGLGTRL